MLESISENQKALAAAHLKRPSGKACLVCVSVDTCVTVSHLLTVFFLELRFQKAVPCPFTPEELILAKDIISVMQPLRIATA